MTVAAQRPENEDSAIERLRSSGDAELASVFEREKPRLRQLIQSHLGVEIASRVDDSDIIQDTYIRASKNLSSYLADATVPPYVWIRKIALEAIESVSRFHRGTKKRTTDLEESADLKTLGVRMLSPRSQVLRYETLQLIEDRIRNLGERDCEILLLRHSEHLSLREIAFALSLDYNTARKRYFRALQRLREALHRDDVRN